MLPTHHPAIAPLIGLRETLHRGPPHGELEPGLRADGLTALVTGVSSGLGFAVAVELARRGVRVVGACRTATDEVRSALVEASGSQDIELLAVDLADLDQVRALPGRLTRPIDRLICNAGMVAARDHRTDDGLERMMVVNHLANHVLIEELCGSGSFVSSPRPRIIVVSSEAHRGAAAPGPDALAAHEPFSIGGSMRHYGTSKLLLLTLARRLSRTLEGVDVHALCPGPVDSRLAREAPRFLQPVLALFFRLFFQPPAVAARPIVYLALSPSLEGSEGLYLHQGSARAPDVRTNDPQFQDAVWKATREVLAQSAL